MTTSDFEPEELPDAAEEAFRELTDALYQELVEAYPFPAELPGGKWANESAQTQHRWALRGLAKSLARQRLARDE